MAFDFLASAREFYPVRRDLGRAVAGGVESERGIPHCLCAETRIQVAAAGKECRDVKGKEW
jgi:hypothetical protein